MVGTALELNGVRGVRGVSGFPGTTTRCRGVIGPFFDKASRYRGVCGVAICNGFEVSPVIVSKIAESEVRTYS